MVWFAQPFDDVVPAVMFVLMVKDFRVQVGSVVSRTTGCCNCYVEGPWYGLTHETWTTGWH